MRRELIFQAIEENPVITAVKDLKGLETCLKMDSKVVFLLFGDICNVSELVKKGKAAGKIMIVHMDLLSGIGNKEIAADFIRKQTQTDGIISTRPAILKRAKELGLFTIFRCFILDSMALSNAHRQAEQIQPDMMEILPGVMPKVTKKIVEQISIPIICGGLISDKEDIIGALSAGAAAISSTNPYVWKL